MSKYDYIIGLDPGISGGIAIMNGSEISALKIPVKSVIVNKKTKNIYDVEKIVEIFAKYKDKNVLFIQEAVSCMPGEGAVSSFGFGKSSGLTLGMASALGFKIVEVHPQKWKKYFSELTNPVIGVLKEEAKKKKEEGKLLKDKALKKLNKKEIDRLNRRIKAEMKASSISLVKEKFPEMESILKYKNTDGVAESILIALFGQENQNELV